MINIPEDFLKAEERLNFLIPAKMKKAWAVQLTVLDNILEVANRHNISLWLDYGSLLGAVRHKGYIPWDDDIDVCVFRKDYLRLLQLLQVELPDYMMVYSFYTWEDYDQPKAFVANRRNVDQGNDPKEAAITEIYYGCPYGTGIDLYPLDYAPKDEAEWEYTKHLYNAVYDLAMDYDKYLESGELEEYLVQIEGLLNVSIERDSHIKYSLWKLADRIAMMTPASDAGSILWYPDEAMRSNDMRRPLNAYVSTIMSDFEFIKVPIPAGYDTVLSICYGQNYMTPIRQSGIHNYPFYAEQDDRIKANISSI